MAALILVQVYWIKNAVVINERQFGQLIQRSMIEIADEIEKREVAKMVTRIGSPVQPDSGFVFNSTAGEETGQTGSNPVYDATESQTGSNIPGDQTQTERERWLANRRQYVDRVIAGMLYESPDIEKRISPTELEFIIKNILEESGINLEFKYAVTRLNYDIVFASPGYNPAAETDYYKVQLLKDNIFAGASFLTIYFPDKKDFLYQSLIYVAISSLILTLAILSSFVITVFVMFRQKKLSEIRSDFVSNMTHELKTPISTISLASQLLSDKSIPEEVKKTERIAKIITDECKRLGSQVEKVLQTAVFDKGKLKLKKSEINMHELILSVVDTFSLQIKSRSGKITLMLNAVEFMLMADQVHITNLLSNLFDNAIKYCNRNPEILVTTANKGEFLMISVKDNGIGIAKNELRRIFEKFYRVPTGNVHTVKGFGLGLSYVKMIVAEHNGHIEVESELYQGSTFSVFLPLKELVPYAKN